MFLLDTLVDAEGIEPSSLPCEGSIFPLDHAPGSSLSDGAPGGIRTRDLLSDKQAATPLACEGICLRKEGDSNPQRHLAHTNSNRAPHPAGFLPEAASAPAS